MASIEPRGRKDGTIGYRVDWMDPDHPVTNPKSKRYGKPGRRSLTFDDRREAERLVELLDANGQRLANAAAILKAIRANGCTVAEMIEEYLKHLTGVEAQTREDYRALAAHHINPIIGVLPAETIERDRIRLWVNQVSAPDPVRLGCLLTQARKDAGLSREQLATRITGSTPDDGDLSPQQLAARLARQTAAIGRHETGRRVLSADELTLVCKAAGLPHTRRSFYASVSNGMNPKTLQNVHSLLSAAFTWAVLERKLRQDNPAKGIKLLDYNPAEMTFLTPREFGTFLRYFTQPYTLVVQFMAGTGVRWGELIALNTRDIHLDVPHPYVNISKAVKRKPGGHYTGAPKSMRSRRLVSLPASLVGPLRDLIADRDRGALLFVGPKGGRLHHSNFYSRQWVPAVEAAEKEIDKGGWRIHDLRHSHASWLIASGVDLATVQRRLGHESIVTTVDRYGHLDPRQLQAGAEAADGVLAELITPPELDPIPDGAAVVDLELARRLRAADLDNDENGGVSDVG